ncbi:MAG: DUF7342 family protein, partial [Haloferacaceae archaeon]
MAKPDAADGPPPFEDAFAGDDVEQRIYGTILQTRKPTTASSIADTAECDPKTARKYLDWFEQLGIVTQSESHPVTYERNDAYFEWRRINQLAAEQSVAELQERVRELTTRITEYEDTYDAVSP